MNSSKLCLFVIFSLLLSNLNHIFSFLLNSKFKNNYKKFSHLNLKDELDHKTAVIIIDHGSKRELANKMLVELCNKYKEKYQIEIVEPAHMEIAEPSIMTACEKCISQGAKRIICHPYFLSKGKHIQEDIPNLIESAKLKFSNTEIILTEPVGCSDMILDIVHTSILNTLQNSDK